MTNRRKRVGISVMRWLALAAIAGATAPAWTAAQQATTTDQPGSIERLNALAGEEDYHALMRKLAIPDRPDLPQLFFCGDSISQHNAPSVKVALCNRFDVTHWLDLPTRYPQSVPRTPYSGTSELLIEMLTAVLNSADYHPTYLVLNAGLHDATYEIPVEQYRANLIKVVKLANEHHAKMVWMLTTPRTKGHPHNNRIDSYNVAAREVMAEHDVPIIDLHRFVLDAVANDGEPMTYNGDDVHYAVPVRNRMGAFLGEQLRKIFKEDLAPAKCARDATN